MHYTGAFVRWWICRGGGAWGFGFRSQRDRRNRLSHCSRLVGLRVGLAPRVLKALQFALGSGIGALQAALALPKSIEQGELILSIVGIFEEINLAYFHSDQFPLRDRHLFDIELFGPGLGMPFDFEIVAKLR